MFRFLMLCTLSIQVAWANTNAFSEQAEVKVFIDKMVDKHDFQRAELVRILDQIEVRPKVIRSVKKNPEKEMTWQRYSRIFMTEKRITEGVQFWQKHQKTLQAAAEKFGVPEQFIVAILGVETLYGTRMGSYRVIDSLGTLAFNGAPRQKFFQSELEQYLLLTRENQLPVLELKGSYAGAMGMGQFISSSYRHYAVDFDGDGQANLFNNPKDAIGSIANYIAKHSWKQGQPIAVEVPYQQGFEDLKAPKRVGKKHKISGAELQEKFKGFGWLSPDQKVLLMEMKFEHGSQWWIGLQNFYSITRYNHSPLYAMAVFQLANAIETAYQKNK